MVRQALFWSDLADAGLFSFSIDNCEDLEVAKREVGSDALCRKCSADRSDERWID